jgi:hypothetical protein
VVAGVDEHDLEGRLDGGGEVDHDRVVHRGGEAQERVELLHRPGDDGRRRFALEAGVERSEVLVAEHGAPEMLAGGGVENGHRQPAAHSPTPTSATYGPVSSKST